MGGSYRTEYGRHGEDRASFLLEQKGYSVINRNYYAGHLGEIDIIAVKDSTILFVEVKTRSSESFGGPIRSITKKKLSSLRKSANHFLVNNPEYNRAGYNYRFDLICSIGDEVEWIEDIIR